MASNAPQRPKAMAAATTTTVPAHYPVRWPLLIVGCIVAIFAGMWLLFSGQNYQERLTLMVAQTNSANITSYLTPDDPMPAYYLFVHLLATWLPLGVLDLRLLSLACYVLALPIAYAVAYAATSDRRIGLMAAALIGLSPFMVWFGSRATVYALLALIVLVNSYFFVGILRGRTWFWLGYISTGLLGLGLHFFFIIVLLTQVLFGLLERRLLAPLSQVLLALSGAMFVGALGVWIDFSARHTMLWSQLPFTAQPIATNVFIIFVEFLFGFQAVETITFVIALWPLLVIMALLAVQKYVRPPIAIRYFVCAAFVPVLIMFALGWLTRPLFLSSYLIVCLPPFMILVAWYVVAFELPVLVWARNILIGVMVIMLLLELANTERALTGDYLGVITRVRRLELISWAAS